MTVLISIDCRNGTAIGYQDRSAFDRERERIEADDEALIRHLRETFGYTRAAVLEYNKRSCRLTRLSELKSRLAEHIRFENLQGL
jgi:hypothetical protein